MNLSNLFKVDYWFGQPFSAQGVTLWILIGIFLFFILAGLVCKILAQFQDVTFKKVILKRLGSLGLTMGFLAMVWMLFRQEGIQFLAWRFWLLLWAVGVAWWGFSIAQYLRKRVPDIKEDQERRARIEKYLPKPNK